VSGLLKRCLEEVEKTLCPYQQIWHAQIDIVPVRYSHPCSRLSTESTPLGGSILRCDSKKSNLHQWGIVNLAVASRWSPISLEVVSSVVLQRSWISLPLEITFSDATWKIDCMPVRDHGSHSGLSLYSVISGAAILRFGLKKVAESQREWSELRYSRHYPAI